MSDTPSGLFADRYQELDEARGRGTRDASRVLQLQHEQLAHEQRPTTPVIEPEWEVLDADMGLRQFHKKKADFEYQKLTKAQVAKVWKSPQPPMLIGNVAVHRDLELRNLLVVGTPGSGKTQAITAILAGVRKRGQPAIIADLGAAQTEFFYRDGHDYMLNPLDERSQGWTIFNEFEDTTDFDMFAKRIIPDQSNNQDWVEQARMVLSDIMLQLYKKGDFYCTNEFLFYYVFEAPKYSLHDKDYKTASLQLLLTGTPSARIFEQGSDAKGVTITLGIIARSMTPLRHLKDGDFSVRRYIKSFENPGEQDRWLFLSFAEEDYEALASLIAMWIEIAVKASLTLRPNSRRRFWWCLDEFGTLRKMDPISDLLTKARKFGGCTIGGVQTVGQIEKKYGQEGAQEILAAFGSMLMLRVSDPRTAEFLSQVSGDTIVEMESTGVSHGDKTTTSENVSKQVQRLLFGAEFMKLPDLCGYLRVAGAPALVSIGQKPGRENEPHTPPIPITDLPKIAPAKVPRMSKKLAWLRENDPHWKPLALAFIEQMEKQNADQ